MYVLNHTKVLPFCSFFALFLPNHCIYQKGLLAGLNAPLLLLKKDGDKHMDIVLREVFDYDNKVLKNTNKSQETPIKDLEPKKNKPTGGRGLASLVFTHIAEAINTSFRTDWVKLINSRPSLLPMLNKVIKDKYQKEAYAKLSEEIKLKFNQNTKGDNKEILNKINWIDLARIWHYQLGDLNLFGGIKDGPIIFEQNAFTTQSIISHPGLKIVHEYANARLKEGNTDSFSILLQYGSIAFWSAVRDNDVMQNLMGSFTINIDPSKSLSTNQIEYEIKNDLSLSSATRFMEDHTGVIEDQKRYDTEKTKNSYLDFGGTLYCQWKFNLPVTSKK
jgi:hypothetical protein